MSKSTAQGILRLSLVPIFLLAAVLLTSSLHPSPWISDTTVSLFLRLPPRLDPHHGTIPPVKNCQNLALTTIEPREKAAIVVLLREEDLEEMLATLVNFEEKFNRNFRYPYVFIGSPDVPDFSPSFREAIMDTFPIGSEVEWSVIPQKEWEIPKWMDEGFVREGFEWMGKQGVQHAEREGYHHMCRWYSGPFARMEVLEKYDWYWRLEPGVRFYCSITYDPFRFLASNNKVYGFVITIVETPNTIPTLFETLQSYRKKHSLNPGARLWNFLVEEKDGKEEYNMCHFWTNFEIGDLRFFRSESYQSIFNELDSAGGFYTERWGDAPIRTLALSLLTDTDQIHYFEEIAYKHDAFVHCPPKGTGCDCRCPKFGDGFVDIDKSDWYSCLPKWKAALSKGIL